MKHRVFVALGSNIEDRALYLRQAIEKLNEQERIKVTRLSSIYETEPVGMQDQAKFLNMVMELYTSLNPLELLQMTQQVERELKRTREVRWGPRTIDLDILLFNDENIRMDELIVPHPRMCERAFVIVPLREIAPAARCPQNGWTAAEMFVRLPEEEKAGVVLWKKSS
ncbi:2-amino-4-hydroxy-6-hydroxymethyldihydropteridine diphosphokinase [Bacillus piscicola]|uniref:2-amino-4-hydroxy-6- hydroxymethyldihydropteridine diphosphokinase n=1 Tax=Bacillus piscicola TaxID=1632684 RepID=UPI001F094609|nr:2-amino-4-hydroxy-6-hydroxymethyldihydropteridine diphosphokinase [Bacillus piscicola]